MHEVIRPKFTSSFVQITLYLPNWTTLVASKSVLSHLFSCWGLYGKMYAERIEFCWNRKQKLSHCYPHTPTFGEVVYVLLTIFLQTLHLLRFVADLSIRLIKTLKGASLALWWICTVRQTPIGWLQVHSLARFTFARLCHELWGMLVGHPFCFKLILATDP